MPRGAAVAAIVAAAFADGVVHTSRAFGSLAQSVPAATRRVASRVDGPPALSIDAVASGGSPPDRGSNDEEAAAVPVDHLVRLTLQAWCNHEGEENEPGAT